MLNVATDITLCFDGDNAGIRATQSAIDKIKGKATVYVIKLPKDTDPGSLDIHALRKLYLRKKIQY